MAGSKIWCKSWIDGEKSLENLDLDTKTLTDFHCEECGYIQRLLISFREFSIPRYCERCGGHLENRADENLILRVMKMTRKEEEIRQPKPKVSELARPEAPEAGSSFSEKEKKKRYA